MSAPVGVLEMARAEFTLLGLRTLPKAPAGSDEVLSQPIWEPSDPIVHPYGPDPSVVLPMDLHDEPEDRAAARKAREARNA